MARVSGDKKCGVGVGSKEERVVYDDDSVRVAFLLRVIGIFCVTFDCMGV